MIHLLAVNIFNRNPGLNFLARWAHVVVGIVWIGLLYYFNFVQTPAFAQMEPAARNNAIDKLASRALWWFRWGAIVTWFSGFIYLGYFTSEGKEIPANAGTALLLFLLIWSAAFVVISAVYRASVAGSTLKNGWMVTLVVAIVVIVAAWLMTSVAHKWGASNRASAIMVGGGLGTIMLMNVWMIIWPLQKKIIAATIAAQTGTPAPADQPKWARRGFLASRTNAWLSIPMLFFMGAASHFPIFSTVTK